MEYLGLSAKQIVYVVLVFISTVFLSQVVNYFLKRGFDKYYNNISNVPITHRDSYEQSITKFSIIKRLVVIGIYFIGLAMIILSFPEAKTIAISMLAGAGVIAIIIGFAVQSLFADVISGIMIAFTQPYRIGDYLLFRGEFGMVEDIGLRHTTFKVWDNKRLLIPNNVAAKEVIINYSIKDPLISKVLLIPVHYSTDLDMAKKIMIDEYKKHRYYVETRTKQEIENNTPPTTVFISEFADSSIVLRMVIAASDPIKAFVMQHELRENIKKSFDKAKIVIPYPQREVHIKNE